MKGWDITLNYLYAYDDFPVAKSVLSIETSGPLLTVSPMYKRYHLTGGTFTNSFGKFTLRGELGFFIDKTFVSPDPTIREGLFKSTQGMGVIGVDYSGISNTTISAQVFEDYVFSNTTVTGRSRNESYVSLLLSRNYKNETITTEVICVQNLNRGDGFVRPKIKYQMLSNLNISLGSDLFYGPASGLFGQFNKMNRGTLTIQWGI